ncbi:cell division transport system permease protein [Arcanobacterium wilhelmae]|uniref:Cell division protein FtsX n=1 Tax=Arcanobacterium wilhelmae TaxID=1803177 RepID=A0ABT9NCP6_9ACTO|nr:permease-like cell division protein FtsX [Arcanobacterium wilhelmae]MDP9801500.1 cell division transport system permease protein [Arcanobacterium wilhelmae]WFN90831.1 permease-like cell division protein FtsX [Arcanobacterium wilhelmae]
MAIRFLLSQAFKGLRRNASMAASVALVTFVSLLFLGSAVLLQGQISNMKNDWYDKVEVSAFMCPTKSTSAQCAGGEATAEQIDSIGNLLKSTELKPYVEKVYFETKEDALKSFQKQMAGTNWVQSLTADEMQASYRVKLVNPEQYKIVAEALSGQPGVESVVDQREQLEPLFNMLNRLTYVAGILAGVMIVTGLLLIPSTIRLSAMFRRNETQIMRFVGASNMFIQAPFILESAIAALFGSLLAVGALYVAVEVFISRWFSSQLIDVVSGGDVLVMAPFLIIGAVVVSVLASFVALRRYTRV